MKRKYLILLFLSAIALCWGIYAFVQVGRQKAGDRQFSEDCSKSELIKFRRGYVIIHPPNDFKNSDSLALNILHIRSGLISDTLEYKNNGDDFDIAQFDLRTYDTLQIIMGNEGILNLHGFKNEPEYRYPNKVIDCNFQTYMIESFECEVKEYAHLWLDDYFERENRVVTSE